MLRPKWLLIAWSTALLAVAALILICPAHGVSEEPRMLVNRNLGNINYVAGFDPVQQQVYAEVSFDYFNPEKVHEYISLNRKLSQEMAQRGRNQLRVIIHFRRPLSQKEFETFVWNYDLRVHRYFMRAVEKDGWRVGIGGAPAEGQLIPHHLLDTVIKDIRERNDAEFKGWVSVETTTDSVHLRQMLADPDVVLIEVSPTLILESLTPQALRQAGASPETIQKLLQDPDQVVQITCPFSYWNLEELGLVPMPTHSLQE